jgi:hypothetical protein
MVIVVGSTEDIKSNYNQNVAHIAATDWSICITVVHRQKKKSVCVGSVTETLYEN